jgi:ABC-type glutathione transport system ATPase component
MIFQDPYSSLNPRHTVGTIVGAPFRIQGVKTEHGTKRAVQEILELVGLKGGIAGGGGGGCRRCQARLAFR